VVDHINPNRYTDSAGVPWEGRALEENKFAGDDGNAPKELIEVIASFRQGLVGAEKVVDQIRTSRLLVPLIAELGEAEVGPHGKLVDKSAELSVVTVKSPDDQDSLVVFSSVTSMSNWNPNARPVPTDAVRVCLAAASQLSTRVVLDPGSENEFVLRRPVIAKIAQSFSWLPPEKNEDVKKVVGDSMAGEKLVLNFELRSGDSKSLLKGAELEIVVRLEKGAAPESVRELIERLSQFWSRSELFAASVDSVAIKLEAN
jgi:hypothetical protein